MYRTVPANTAVAIPPSVNGGVTLVVAAVAVVPAVVLITRFVGKGVVGVLSIPQLLPSAAMV